MTRFLKIKPAKSKPAVFITGESSSSLTTNLSAVSSLERQLNELRKEFEEYQKTQERLNYYNELILEKHKTALYNIINYLDASETKRIYSASCVIIGK